MTALEISPAMIDAILAEVEAAKADEAWIIARPTPRHRLFSHSMADTSEAGAVAETIAQVEGRPAEVHYLRSGRLARIDVHHPDGSVSRPAMYRTGAAGSLITAIVL